MRRSICIYSRLCVRSLLYQAVANLRNSQGRRRVDRLSVYIDVRRNVIDSSENYGRVEQTYDLNLNGTPLTPGSDIYNRYLNMIYISETRLVAGEWNEDPRDMRSVPAGDPFRGIRPKS